MIDLTKVSSHDSVFVHLRIQNRFPRKIGRLFSCYKDMVVFILPAWNFTRTSHQAKSRGNICIYYDMFLYTTFTFSKKRGCEKQTVQLKIQNSSCTNVYNKPLVKKSINDIGGKCCQVWTVRAVILWTVAVDLVSS